MFYFCHLCATSVKAHPSSNSGFQQWRFFSFSALRSRWLATFPELARISTYTNFNVEVTLRPPVSRPVCLGVKSILEPETRFSLLWVSCSFFYVRLLYELRFTAKQFVLTPISLSLTTREALPFVPCFIVLARIAQKTPLLAALIFLRGYPLS
jgi:hypothetical protein